MDTFLFNSDKMARLYNCSGRTFEEWRALGRPSILIGVFYIALGVVYLTTYLPFMLVFVKTNLLRHSCYKIMFLLGVIDCTCIPVGSFYCGWASIIGINYCMYPRLQYVMGQLSLALWTSGSTTCILLAFNRCVDLLSPKLVQLLFVNERTYYWFLLPAAYFAYFFVVHPTCVFSSVLYAFFFDPFLGIPERHGATDSDNYPHMVHATHNFLVAVVLAVLYSLLIVALHWRSRNSERISAVQKRTAIQAIFICSGTFLAALIYMYMQFFPSPLAVVVFAHSLWLSSHGMVGIVYLVFNATLRKALLRLCKNSYSVGRLSSGNKSNAPTRTAGVS